MTHRMGETLMMRYREFFMKSKGAMVGLFEPMFEVFNAFDAFDVFAVCECQFGHSKNSHIGHLLSDI